MMEGFCLPFRGCVVRFLPYFFLICCENSVEQENLAIVMLMMKGGAVSGRTGGDTLSSYQLPPFSSLTT
jgi:hypothetical protein